MPKSRSSPTQLSLAHLRAHGWTVCVVEKFNHFAKIRQDAFGFGDLLACRKAGEISLIQTTTSNNMRDRKIKVIAAPEFWKWKSAGGLVFLHGWAKRGPRGRRKLWTLTEERL